MYVIMTMDELKSSISILKQRVDPDTPEDENGNGLQYVHDLLVELIEALLGKYGTKIPVILEDVFEMDDIVEVVNDFIERYVLSIVSLDSIVSVKIRNKYGDIVFLIDTGDPNNAIDSSSSRH